jgi:L-threonylcarbamoyladenylate synthase
MFAVSGYGTQKRSARHMKRIFIENTHDVPADAIEQIADSIRKDQTIILPAKTIYGISCSYKSKAALDKVYKIKKRAQDMPFILLIADVSQLALFAEKISGQAQILIERYWTSQETSPLTLVLKKARNKENDILTERDTIAVRIAEFAFVREAIRRSAPIISTSATISTVKALPVSIKQVPPEIIESCDLVVDVKEDLLGIESTIVDASKQELSIIREGAVGREEILSLF